jgi:hypothetical protein
MSGCNLVHAGSDKLTFTSKTGLSAFLVDDFEIDSTVRKRRGDPATVMCSTARPVVLHYGKDSTHVKFNFTYVRHNAYGNATTSY